MQILLKHTGEENPSHFMSKLTDTDAENTETEVWIDFAFAAKYITETEYKDLLMKKEEAGRFLGNIIKNPSKYS